MNHNIFKDADPVNVELLKNAEVAVKRGLLQAFQFYEELKHAPKTETPPEEALRMSVYFERIMMDSLGQLPYKFLVRSRQNVDIEVNAHMDGPRYLATMEGLSGSKEHQEQQVGADYGPMFAIFSNDNPTFDDYVASGLMLLSSGEMLLAKKDGGATGESVRTGERFKVKSDQMAELDEDAIVFVDQPSVSASHSRYDVIRRTDSDVRKLERVLGVRSLGAGSSVANIAAIAKGAATLTVGAIRTDDLEFNSGYGILKEAGAAIQTQNGKNIGTERMLGFGQNEPQMVIAAANSLVADEVWYSLEA